MKTLRVNGQVRQFESEEMPDTVSTLVEKLGIAASTVVAEVDGRIVRPPEFEQTPLSEGQSIELIKFMGGG
jgi:thiamine biosynthesis protein ThiS